MRIYPYQLHPIIDPCGRIAFNCAEAEEYWNSQIKCILCRNETSVDDIGGLNVRLLLYKLIIFFA
jgi:hypothetical protein